MTAHGADPDATDQEVFTDICIMWADGVIGNRGLLETLGCLTGAVYNYMRSEGQRAYKLEDIIPKSYEYLYPPLTEEEKKRQVNEALVSYLKASPNAPAKIYKG